MIHLLSLNKLNQLLPDPETYKGNIWKRTATENDPANKFKNKYEVIFEKQKIRGKYRWVLKTPIIMHTDLY